MIEINNSITLSYISMKKLKTSTIGVYIHRPLLKSEASFNALLPYVLKRGCSVCKNREDLEHYLDELYGAELRCGTVKKGEDQIIYFTLESISEKYTPNKESLFKELMNLCLSVIFQPVEDNGAFNSEYFEQEKKNAIERIESIKNDKRSYAALRCSVEMFDGDDFAVASYGSIEEIKKINPQSLYKHYKKIINSSKMDFYVSGDCNESEIAGIISKKVSSMSFNSSPIGLRGAFINSGDVKYIEEKMDVTQGKLALGFTTGVDPKSKEYYALMVCNSVFGGGAHSKLFNNVREKLSLCYYASSSVERYKTTISVNAGIEFHNYQKAYDEILAQLDSVVHGDITELEFTSSINAIVNSIKTCMDDQYAMQSFDLSERLLETNMSIEDCIKEIEKVTIDDVVRVAKNIRLDTVYFLKGMNSNENASQN